MRIEEIKSILETLPSVNEDGASLRDYRELKAILSHKMLGNLDCCQSFDRTKIVGDVDVFLYRAAIAKDGEYRFSTFTKHSSDNAMKSFDSKRRTIDKETFLEMVEASKGLVYSFEQKGSKFIFQKYEY